MLAKDYWQPETFCEDFTHICRAHQAPRAIPWLYCTRSSQSWSALAHLKYKNPLPIPNPALRWRGYWCCVCISLSLNHEGYRVICNHSRISTLLYLCYWCFSIASALPTTQHHIFLMSALIMLLRLHQGLAAFQLPK